LTDARAPRSSVTATSGMANARVLREKARSVVGRVRTRIMVVDRSVEKLKYVVSEYGVEAKDVGAVLSPICS
jgi:hypothetical protein